MHGWLAGGSCKKRTCSKCGLVWAKDWRVVLFTNLKHLGGFVMLSAVTPPGQDLLPYDEAHCAHLGRTGTGSTLVVGSTLTPWLSGPMTFRSGGSGSTTQLETRSSASTAGACRC